MEENVGLIKDSIRETIAKKVEAARSLEAKKHQEIYAAIKEREKRELEEQYHRSLQMYLQEHLKIPESVFEILEPKEKEYLEQQALEKARKYREYFIARHAGFLGPFSLLAAILCGFCGAVSGSTTLGAATLLFVFMLVHIMHLDKTGYLFEFAERADALGKLATPKETKTLPETGEESHR